MLPGDELELRGDLRVRAVRTFHPVPSLGVHRSCAGSRSCAPELHGLPGPEIAARRRAGEADRRARGPARARVRDRHAGLGARPLARAATRARADHGVHVPRRPQVARGRARRLPHPPRRGDRARRPVRERARRADALSRSCTGPTRSPAILDARVPPALRARIIPFVPAERPLAGLMATTTTIRVTELPDRRARPPHVPAARVRRRRRGVRARRAGGRAADACGSSTARARARCAGSSHARARAASRGRGFRLADERERQLGRDARRAPPAGVTP